jgi:hypothetical protein
VNLLLRVRTVNKNAVRNLREEKKNCNCSLSNSFTITGEVFVDGFWHRSSWNSSGINASGIPGWALENY